MPIEKVGMGYRFGKIGKVYYGPNAYILARRQAIAASISKARQAGHKVPSPLRRR